MNMNEPIGRDPHAGPLRIAVVGAGIAGLASAWLLGQRHRVTLFESENRLGGHANTVEVELEGQRHPVDTGFLVFNRRTYPNLCALYAHIGVEAHESEMSFSVSLREPDLEWAGSDFGTLFAQRSNLLRPAFWGMLSDILRFNRTTTRLAAEGALPQMTLGEYLALEGYGRAFRDWYLLPMAAAIWSCPTRQMLAYPLATFVRFCHNHGLLQIFDRPQWLSVAGGSREYVRRLAARIADVRCGCLVHALERDDAGVTVRSAAGAERFDAVVLACHSDQALGLLGVGATPAERAVLGAVRYQPNTAWLHTDEALMPRRRATWSAWNYRATVAQDGAPPSDAPVSVTYWLNRLQRLPFKTPVLVSLNPDTPPEPARVLQRFEYAHPVFDLAAIDMQSRLNQLQGNHHTWFAGAWAGYGFHEDGLRAALEVARQFGLAAPWQSVGALSRSEPGRITA